LNLSPTNIQSEVPPPPIVRNTAIPSVRQAPIAASEISDDEQPAWLDEQYQRDLETLDRIERQREEADPCFFCAMGDIARERMETPT
jgi:hypothetical protein